MPSDLSPAGRFRRDAGCKRQRRWRQACQGTAGGVGAIERLDGRCDAPDRGQRSRSAHVEPGCLRIRGPAAPSEAIPRRARATPRAHLAFSTELKSCDLAYTDTSKRSTGSPVADLYVAATTRRRLHLSLLRQPFAAARSYQCRRRRRGLDPDETRSPRSVIAQQAAMRSCGPRPRISASTATRRPSCRRRRSGRNRLDGSVPLLRVQAALPVRDHGGRHRLLSERVRPPNERARRLHRRAAGRASRAPTT